jgi:GNAT superfamily N-acetyltransferase
MTAHIRPGRPADAAHLPAIERAAGALFRTLPDLAWIADDDVLDEATHAAAIAAGESWVATLQDRLVGFVVTEHGFDRLHVREIAVHPDAQAQGLGRRLMHTVIDHARSEHLAAVTLTTFRTVPWNAPFYARLGFEILEGDALSPDLAALLRAEAAHGLKDRCAMRLVV